MGIKFESLGHVAETLGWTVRVVNGTAVLISTDAGAYDRTDTAWEAQYSVKDLRQLADLLSGAADLLDDTDGNSPPVKPGQELTLEQLKALPVGSKVRDREGDVWTRLPAADQFEWGMNNDTVANSSTNFIHRNFSPLTLVSADGAAGERP